MRTSTPDHDPGGECCRPASDPRVARAFDRRAASSPEGDLPEMFGVSAALLDRLRDAPLARPTVLEIGCGTGALAVALLEIGARQVTGVDLSAASLEMARRRAADAGFDGQSRFVEGDASSVEVDLHEWVILDRVLCCDANLDGLLDRAIGAAGARIALSVPESHGWRGLVNRPLWAAESLWDRATGGCPGYVHSVRRISRRLAAAGFVELPGRRHLELWYLGVFERQAAA